MNKVVVLLVLIFAVYSCEQSDLENEPEKTTSSYLPMAIGNYWIYEVTVIPYKGTTRIYSDSSVIDRDTVINDTRYFILDNYSKNSNVYKIQDTQYLRDSSKYLVTEDGRILFSEVNFEDSLQQHIEYFTTGDTMYTSSRKMEKLSELEVPAGTFSDILYAKLAVYTDTALSYLPIDNPRFVGNYYAPNVGLIQEVQTWIYSGGYRYRKLKSYSLVE